MPEPSSLDAGGSTILPGAEPVTHDGETDVGVLLCHGLTSTPQSMRSWGEQLAASGLSVRCPLLPGHGTTWRDANKTRWTDWYAAVEQALRDLRSQHRSVFVCGQSMGGALALRLAQQHGDIAGLVLVNPSVTTTRRGQFLLPLVRHVVPRLPGIADDIARPGAHELGYRWLPLHAADSLRQLWQLVRSELAEVTQPLVLYRSAHDHVVEPVNARIVLNGVSSQDRNEVVLPNSHHVATLDHDAPTVFNGSVEFLHRIHRDRVEDRT